jgi:PrtD family type I secretion system ABC transporter
MTSAQSRSPIAAVLMSYRSAFVATSLFSGLINVLMLTGSFFMLQVYDRVLPSRSIPTLVVLLVIVAALYAFQGVLELIRTRMLARIGASLDQELSAPVFALTVALPLQGRGAFGLQPLRDVDQLRSFLAGTGPSALFDLPWMPLYIGLCFLFHFWIGVTATAGAVILVALTLASELLTREPAKAAAMLASSRLMLAEACRRNGEVLQAMGMTARLTNRWEATNDKHLDAQQRAADIAASLGTASKILRMLLQSAVLAVGAYLVIQQEATAGIIIASSILTSRALAPVELVIANWKGFLSARQSWRRLSELIKETVAALMPLPGPRETVVVEAVSVAPPGVARLAVQDMSFQLKRGQGLAIIGPTASGKSSLVRALVGVWPPARGKVRLDAAAIDQWSAEALGPHIGYLPQDVELFDGTVAENIARFTPGADPASVIEAARCAGVDELIRRLPEGYDFRIGEAGSALSAGQRQRIALARALYGDPFLVVLDEPNSNLDSEGEEALTQAILGVRARGGIVVIVAHRANALAGVDLVLAMANGRAQACGPKDEVLRGLQQQRPGPRPMKVADGEGR